MFEFSEYNPYTITGRPSNSFNNVNYAALNKDDGSRKRFISRFGSEGYLLDIDLSGFHLYLLYTICNIPFPSDIYTELSKFYPESVNPKDHTFKQIYGGIDYNLLGIEPFKSFDELSRQTWKAFNQNQLKTFLFERPIFKENFKDVNQNKIFNYMLQNLETEFNSLIINGLLEGLRLKQSKLILYTYDSFLFDCHKSETNDIIDLIKTTFNGIKYHIKVGSNYDDMKVINND